MRNLVQILTLLAVVATLFILVNEPNVRVAGDVVQITRTFQSGLVFFLFSAFIFMVASKSPDLLGRIPIETLGPQVIVGAIFGGVFIFAQSASGIFSIGLPKSPLSLGPLAGQIVVIFIAPIVEELFFRGVMYHYLANVLSVRPFMANVIQATAFALFHLNVFGSFFASSGNFIGAFIFGLIAGYVSTIFGSGRLHDVFPAVVAHALINFREAGSRLAFIT